MHLLSVQHNGAFGLTEFTSNETPPYAILSHTWGPDLQEVRFSDVVTGVGQHKAGYRKLEFCQKQADKDGLQYFWIDTCCIDKSSSALLAEAINSMFYWYQKAKHCYVYLPDVQLSEMVADDQTFRASRWFTRGWTLQELLAPKSVRFYTADGQLLGTRVSLVGTIQKATGIPQRALLGEALDHFSVEVRLSWADKCQTKRGEDSAYSLLGLFGVHMPLIYGEGRKNAFMRLRREINESHGSMSLNRTASWVGQASMDTTEVEERILDSLHYPRMEERKLQVHDAQTGTLQWILDPASNPPTRSDSLLNWLSSSSETRRIYWISGKPGSGKSTLMRFLDRTIKSSEHLFPWAMDTSVLRMQFFFWSP